MKINRAAFEKLIDAKFEGNKSRAAAAFLVTPQYIQQLLADPKRQAGADLLGGVAAYCLGHGLNPWDYIILPKRSTIV